MPGTIVKNTARQKIKFEYMKKIAGQGQIVKIELIIRAVGQAPCGPDSAAEGLCDLSGFLQGSNPAYKLNVNQGI